MICQQEIDALFVQCLAQECEWLDDVPPRTERREHRRWRLFNQYANLYWRGVEYWVKIADISLSGLRVANAPNSLAVGKSVLIVTLCDRGTVAVACEVLHLSENKGVRYAGLKFTPHYPEELISVAASLHVTPPSAGSGIHLPHPCPRKKEQLDAHRNQPERAPTRWGRARPRALARCVSAVAP